MYIKGITEYDKNGKEISREKLHTSHYKMYQKTIEYNDGYGGLR